MKERELEILRFEKVKVTAEESGVKSFYYYTYDVVNGISFISNSNDTVKGDKWYVEFFNTEIPVRFHEMGEVMSLINILTKAIVNE